MLVRDASAGVVCSYECLAEEKAEQNWPSTHGRKSLPGYI